MIRTITSFAVLPLLVVGASLAQDARPPAKDQEAKLIAVLKSDAPLKEKEDACRELAIKGTRNAVAPLAALLGEEKLAHMARYGLEPIPDPAVDDALRDALGKVKGRSLAGVIGSIGVRRDTKAIGPLSGFLKDADSEVAQSAARALGRIGSPAAAKALEDALDNAPAANQPALCEGLFRCAEACTAGGHRDQAVAIYDRVNRAQVPPHMRELASRKARFLRLESGPTL